MKKNKLILAVNNFEEYNTHVDYGVNLAKRLARPVTLTSVAKVPMMIGSTGLAGANIPQMEIAQIAQIKENTKERLDKIQVQARQIWNEVDTDVVVGFPEPRYVQKSKEETPYLFVIEGNHDLTTLGEWFGTYETRLAEDIEVPVLIVPKAYAWKPVQDILYVMEISDKSKSENIRILYDLSKHLNAKLHVMMVADEDNEASQTQYHHLVDVMRKFYDYQQVHYHFAAGVKSTDEIKRKVEGMMIDWLALEHSENSFIERVFSNYNSDRLILQSEIPVLVF